MTTASQIQTQTTPLVIEFDHRHSGGGGWGAGILAILGIIFGIALMVNYTVPGMGLAMLWTAAVFGVIGGIVMIIQAFRQRSA